MWIWRRTERISWTEKITSEEVVRRVGENRSMAQTIVGRKEKLDRACNERGWADERSYRW